MDVLSPSFNVILLNCPGFPATAHINIYLPTAGRDADYISDLSKLDNTLDEIAEEYDDPVVIIRGDANASIPVRLSNSRDTLFQYFCKRMGLKAVPTNHKTYHHFTGHGASDSAIDVILHKHSSRNISENIEEIICSKEDPRVDSKHDIIVSKFLLPYTGIPNSTQAKKPPSIPNTKHRIVWSDEGVLEYRNLLSSALQNIQENWKNPASPVSYSVLLQCTNEALTSAAKLTNKVIDLSKERAPPKVFKPEDLISAETAKKDAHLELQKTSSNPMSTELQNDMAKSAFCDARKAHRCVWRRHQAAEEQVRDQKLSSITTKAPSEAFKLLRSVRSSASTKISEIKVGDKIYSGQDVATGFYHNIENLKTKLDPQTQTCISCEHFKLYYKLNKEICKCGEKIPPLSLMDAEKLLHSLKLFVCDQ